MSDNDLTLDQTEYTETTTIANTRKLGLVRLTLRDLTKETFLRLFEGCVIVRAEPDYRTGFIDYYIEHPDLEPVPDLMIIPEYEIVLTDEGRTFTKVCNKFTLRPHPDGETIYLVPENKIDEWEQYCVNWVDDTIAEVSLPDFAKETSLRGLSFSDPVIIN